MRNGKKKRRVPADLTREELVGIVDGLRAVMYGDAAADGRFVWNPDLSVSGADLVEWAGEELARHGLVPEGGVDDE